MILTNNSELKNDMKEVIMPTIKDLDLPIGGSLTANVRLLLPSNVKVENDSLKLNKGSEKLPLVIVTYVLH